MSRTAVAQAARRITRAIRIGFRAAKILARSPELPRTLRVLFVVGLVQVPVLPTDEIALAIALSWLAIFHRNTLRAAFTAAASKEDKS
jgi:hypothetical protein